MSDTAKRPRWAHPLSRERRTAREFRDRLLAHVGPNPSGVQLGLIEEEEAIHLDLIVLRAEKARNGRLAPQDQKTLDFLTAQRARLLARLGMEGPETPVPDYATVLAQRVASRPGAPSPASGRTDARNASSPSLAPAEAA